MAWKKTLALTLCVSDLYDVEIEYILIAGGIRIFILGVVQWLIFLEAKFWVKICEKFCHILALWREYLLGLNYKKKDIKVNKHNICVSRTVSNAIVKSFLFCKNCWTVTHKATDLGLKSSEHIKPFMNSDIFDISRNSYIYPLHHVNTLVMHEQWPCFSNGLKRWNWYSLYLYMYIINHVNYKLKVKLHVL